MPNSDLGSLHTLAYMFNCMLWSFATVVSSSYLLFHNVSTLVNIMCSHEPPLVASSLIYFAYWLFDLMGKKATQNGQCTILMLISGCSKYSCKRNIGGILLTESKWPHSLRLRGHTANQRAAYVTNRSGRWVEDSKICTQIPCGTNLLRSMSFMLQRKVSEILTHCKILDLVTLGTGTILLVTVVGGIWPQYFTGSIGIWREM